MCMSESLHDMLQLVCVVLLLCTHLPSVDMADGSENEDDSDVRLCTKTIVLYGKGEQWIPTQKNEEGLVFGGRQALDLRKDKYSRSLNSKFFDDLMTQRQSTFNEAIQKRLQSEDDQEDTPPQSKKVFKSFKATAAKHQQYAPHCIDIQLPAIEEGGPTPTAKVLFEGLGSQTLWFELTEANLRHLKAGFVNSESKDRQPRAAKRRRGAWNMQPAFSPAGQFMHARRQRI
eukprot:s6570_g1.t1